MNLNQKIENGKVIDWSSFKRVKTENNHQPISLDTFDLYNFYLFFKDLYGNNIPPGDHLIDSAKMDHWQSYTENNKNTTTGILNFLILLQEFQTDETYHT